MSAASPDDGAGAPRYTTRIAKPADAAAITAIYNQGIADRIATFETEPRTPDDIAAWFTPGAMQRRGWFLSYAVRLRCGRVGTVALPLVHFL